MTTINWKIGQNIQYVFQDPVSSLNRAKQYINLY